MLRWLWRGLSQSGVVRFLLACWLGVRMLTRVSNRIKLTLCIASCVWVSSIALAHAISVPRGVYLADSIDEAKLAAAKKKKALAVLLHATKG